MTVTVTRYSVDTELIRWESRLPTVNPKWVFTDKAGHTHTATSDTLITERGEPEWCELCHDSHGEFGCWCAECGEEIRPDMSGPTTGVMPGLTTLHVEGVCSGEPIHIGSQLTAPVGELGPCMLIVTDIDTTLTFSGGIVEFKADGYPVVAL